MIIPVYDLEGIQTGEQIRNPGQRPDFKPKGLKVTECQPHVVRILPKGMILACEGPTDAIAAGELQKFSTWSIVGCWSATTIPIRSFWDTNFSGRCQSLVVACGDNDKSGLDFNQRLSNLLGQAYHLKWSPLLPAKMDVKQYLEEYGEKSFERIIQRSIAAGPVSAISNSRKSNRPAGSSVHFKQHSAVIGKLVEQAAGVLAYPMAGSSSKWYCPLHDDRSDPSLTIDDETGSWKCWANCSRPSQGGPAQFIMAWKKCSYEDAINLLRKYVN